MNKLKTILLENDIKPSYHRLAIFQYLQNNKTHPSVDMIYSDLHNKIPSLSKTTVYNTLNTFVEKKLVQALHIDEHEIRYDPNVNFHAHFKCIKCNTIYDIPHINHDFDRQGIIDGHTVHSYELYLRGICKKCQ